MVNILTYEHNNCEDSDQYETDFKMQRYDFTLNRLFIESFNCNSKMNQKEKVVDELLHKLKKNSYDFLMVSRDPESFIHDYISKIRSDIEVKREKLMLRIKSISDEMLFKLRAFENECNQNIRNLHNLREQNHEYLKNVLVDIVNWKEKLRKPKKHRKPEKLIKEITRKLIETDEIFSDYKNILLNGKECHFHPKNASFEKSEFGEFKLNDSEYTMRNIHESIINNDLLNSEMITPTQATDLIHLCEFDIKKKFKLVYKATRDGFKAEDFHRKCDGLKNTLTVVKEKENSYIFGGYTEKAWESSNSLDYKNDQNSFIFSLKNKENNPLKLKIIENSYSVYNFSLQGPVFGYDLHISSDSNVKDTSYSNLGYNYNHPEYHFGSVQAQNFLAGSKYFRTKDIEVYQVL